MNKKDLIPVLLLVLLIPAWLFIDSRFIAPRFRDKTPAPAEAPAEPAPDTVGDDAAFSAAAPAQEQPAEGGRDDAAVPPVNERLVLIKNEKLQLELTSLGGGIKTALLTAFPELNEADSPPVVLDFADAPALNYADIPGIGPQRPLSIRASDEDRSVSFTREISDGIVFERTVTLGDDYLVTLEDRFINGGTDPWTLPARRILTGRMRNPDNMKSTKGLSILGVDSHTPDGGIDYWGRRLTRLYGKARPLSIDAVPEGMSGVAVDWVSAKNKFFTQILRPDQPVATMSILSSREPEGKGTVPKEVAAALDFGPVTIESGADHTVGYTYYIGPKDYYGLKASGYHMEKVMEFETVGFWSFMNWLMEPARRLLLWTLLKFYAVLGSYGVAIILLTLLVRILFWPLTHKSTEKMRENSEKMQVVQPRIKALQEKYKNNPVKLREETMKVYQEHGFNPMGMMGGCLPMFVQLPVFIALFTVLRNAIELRYAGFLWIADLSAPENLLAGRVPFVGALNILPIVMAASMVWQQKLSSPATAATPEQQQQQKMMMIMMPVMMLVFFYGMPSGLVLYWTTSNLLMIAQTGFRNLRKKRATA